jgi:hypothetical protein
MFHGPWSSFPSGTNLNDTVDQVIHSTNDFLAVPLSDFYSVINFDLPPGQFNIEYNELDQVQSATFQTSFATTGAAGVLLPETSGAVTSNQQPNCTSSSSRSSLNRVAVTGNLPLASEALPQTEQSKTSIHCTEPGCSSSFGTERELHRHQQSIHSGSQFACTVDGCKRGSQKPFNRHDNLHRHMQRVHGQAGLVHIVPESSGRGQKREAETIAYSRSVAGKRRRLIEEALAQTEAQGSPEPALDLPLQLAMLQKQLENAVAENESLKEEVRSLKKGNETRDQFIRELLSKKEQVP